MIRAGHSYKTNIDELLTLRSAWRLAYTRNMIFISCILRLNINTCLSCYLSRWVILCSSYLCGRGHLVLPGQEEVLEPGVREARLQTWIVPTFMFAREQCLEDDSMMTRTIVTITFFMLLWLPGITGHARHVIFITFWWLSIETKFEYIHPIWNMYLGDSIRRPSHPEAQVVQHLTSSASVTDLKVMWLWARLQMLT